MTEFSLGVPTSYAGKLRRQSTGMFRDAAMADPWEGVGKVAMIETHKAQEGGFGWM
jgi:hypothetical protein